jgi:hypothetical protein
MSQSTNNPGETSPSVSDNSTYPPQLHTGAVGLGPEFGKGAVRIDHCVSRQTLVDKRAAHTARQRQDRGLEAGDQRKDQARSRTRRTWSGTAHWTTQAEGDERGKLPLALAYQLSHLKCFPQGLGPPGQSGQAHPDEEQHQQESASQKQPDEMSGHSEGK